jgi:hypothetical protein
MCKPTKALTQSQSISSNSVRRFVFYSHAPLLIERNSVALIQGSSRPAAGDWTVDVDAGLSETLDLASRDLDHLVPKRPSPTP